MARNRKTIRKPQFTLDYWKGVPKQTILGFGHEPGKIGDCWRCCVAAILRMPAAEVPHFVELAAQNHSRSANGLTVDWLAKRGYRLLQEMDGTWFGELLYSDSKIKRLPVILSGVTVRSKDPSQTHAVVDTGIDHYIFDPHPSEAGLLATTRRSMIVRAL